jgi:hypothetical protein
MIEFLQNYGLWIALGGVFLVMHRFGMGCCGGGDQHKPPRRGNEVSGGATNGQKTSEAAPKSSGSCH